MAEHSLWETSFVLGLSVYDMLRQRVCALDCKQLMRSARCRWPPFAGETVEEIFQNATVADVCWDADGEFSPEVRSSRPLFAAA